MKLLIISHTPHYLRDGEVVGWGPTIREIDHLAGLFDQVLHLAVLYEEEAPPSCLPYQADNIKLLPVQPSGGDRLSQKLGVLKAYPEYFSRIWSALSQLGTQDVIHVRCPANVSLLALVLLAFHRKTPNRWVKYAGNWMPAAREDFSYTFQRWYLSHNFHRGVVSVNGLWPEQPDHVYPFFNPSFTAEELALGQHSIEKKILSEPYRFLFVGRLEQEKGVGRIIQIASLLHQTGLSFVLDIIGNGPEINIFKDQIFETGLDDCVRIHGWKPRNKIGEYYSKAHFLLLPSSASEGWPKVLSEGMAYGVVPLAGAVSSIPQYLAQFGTGRALPPDDTAGFARAIGEYIARPELWMVESQRGMDAAQFFTYEAYLSSVRKMMKDAWNLDLPLTTGCNHA